MAKKTTTVDNSIFARRKTEDVFKPALTNVHIYGKSNTVCNTDAKGYATPGGRNDKDIVIDTSEGFVPLWAKNQHLRWRFNKDSFNYFQNPEAAKNGVRNLFSEALLKWGDAAPIKFSERDDAWDFEIVMSYSDDCNDYGCTLASAFFPDSGRHELVVYPKMFTQVHKEQIDTFIHELGHVFGLRHFFANISETRWSSEVYGEHDPFTIMNYGHKSELTKNDKKDLKSLYQKVWSKELTEINGTKIIQVVPFHRLVEGYRSIHID
ncbi:matrixin family metalloprotease [Kordia sp.]|uniref:matrixin family metalloprotease n=1 Tax=Kordia sp. TaxID=1965332 RepID=UPI003B5A2A94